MLAGLYALRLVLALGSRLWQDFATMLLGSTMRWILLVVAVFGFGLTFAAKTPGLMGIGLLVGFIGLLGALFAFAAARIAATSRPDAVLLSDKDINTLRTSLRKPAPPKPGPPADAS